MTYRPVILLGNGVRDNPELIKHLCGLNIPVLLTWPAMDYLDENDPVFCGRPGILGQRHANIIQQKATHLYCFGARLDGEQVSYDYENFGHNAEILVCDIDPNEFKKFPYLGRYHAMGADHASLIERGSDEWLAWCKNLQCRFRSELDGKVDTNGKFVDPFYFMNLLSETGRSEDVFAVGSSGNAATMFMQTFKAKKGQRVSNVSGIGAMGADIPMALGAAMATDRRTICVTGDGGFQLNTQELETIRKLHLPITFFVINNDGYQSIRSMQDTRYNGRRVGSDYNSGLTLPRIEDIAAAYGLQYKSLRNKDLPVDLNKYMGSFPCVVEVFTDPNWKQLPRVVSTMSADGLYKSDPMERMFPYLPDDELKAIMEW